MAVDDREETVLTKVVFDGNWAKAGAIDTALTYGIIAVEAARRRIAFEVTGRRGIDSRNFGEITAIFTEVLGQQGYLITSRADFEEIENKLGELFEAITGLRQRNHEANNRIAELENLLTRCRQAVDEREAEIEHLSEQLERTGEEPEQPADETNIQSSLPVMKATDHILRCDGQHPYRRDEKGSLHPCVLSSGHGTHHRDVDGIEWWDDQGVNSSGVNRGP